MTVKTPNRITTQDYTYETLNSERGVLPKGSFVTPVQPEYLPRHITHNDKFKYFNPIREIYCYSRLGFFPVPKDIIIEV